MDELVEQNLQQLASRNVYRGLNSTGAAPPRRRASTFLSLIVPVLADCFLLNDFVAVMLGGYIACLLLGENWAALRLDVVMASVAAPFVLREHACSWACATSRGAALLSRASGRVAVLLGLIWGVEIVSRTSGDLTIGFLGLWSAAIVALTIQPRALLLQFLRRLERDGVLVRSVALIGAGPAAERTMRQLRKEHGAGLRIAGIFDDSVERAPSGAIAPPGSIDDLIALAQHQHIDSVVIALPWSADARLDEIVNRIKVLDVDVALAPPPLPEGFAGMDLLAASHPALLCRRPLHSRGAVLKALEDLLLAGMLVLCLLPVFALLALAVRLDSPGPILFRQTRVGLNNRPFAIWKFRTMRWDDTAGPTLRQTLRDDNRITQVGRYLRRTSLDELPQLFNVLRGEMSLVGPRPHAVTMRTEDRLGEEIVAEYKHRHRMKPGLTGWAQINGLRGATDTTDKLRRRVEHDLWYIDNWSIWLDLKILALTPIRILGDENAF